MCNHIQHDPQRCNGCGVCVKTCPQMVFVSSGRGEPPEIAHPGRCFGCMACEEDCAQYAIRVQRFPDGENAAPAPGGGIDFERVYDIAIVGAGPAGLGAAIRARMLGLDTVVIERLPSPRRAHHPDGGIIFASKELYEFRKTPDGLRFDELDFTLPSEFVYEWLYDFTFMGPRAQKTKGRTKSWDGFPVVDKSALVYCLAQKAMALGAAISYNTRAYGISQPDSQNRRSVTIEDGREVTARVVISAEGISGRLTHKAGISVNETAAGWSIAPFAELPPVPNPSNEACFILGNGPERLYGDPVPYLGYVSSGTHTTHIAYGPIQKNKFRLSDTPSTDVLREFIESSGRVRMQTRTALDADGAGFDGCRVLLRNIPKSFVAAGLIAVGDTLATCGMLTNMFAMKTGDIAAQTAREAISRNDTSANSFIAYEQRLRRLGMLYGMSWMNNMLIKGPMNLTTRELNHLFDHLESLPLGRVQSGEFMPMLLFFIMKTPAMMFNSKLREYMIPGPPK